MTSSRPPLPQFPIRADATSGPKGLRAYLAQIVQWNRNQRVRSEKTISLLRNYLRQ